MILIGLGGNIGTAETLLQRFSDAVARLRNRVHAKTIRGSALYWSEPVGPIAEQPRFLNAVILMELDRAMAPTALLAELLRLESELGRVRPGSVAKGPRALDLDLLFVDEHVLSTPGPPPLQLPHPGISERAFVLEPLADVMGRNWLMPGVAGIAGVNRSIAECVSAPAVAAQRIERALPASAWLA